MTPHLYQAFSAVRQLSCLSLTFHECKTYSLQIIVFLLEKESQKICLSIITISDATSTGTM